MKIYKVAQGGWGAGDGGGDGGEIIVRVEIQGGIAKVIVEGHADGAKCDNSPDYDLVRRIAPAGKEVDGGKTLEGMATDGGGCGGGQVEEAPQAGWGGGGGGGGGFGVTKQKKKKDKESLGLV